MRISMQNNVSFGTNILDVIVPDHLRKRVKTGLDYVDSVMGGQGFVPSSVTLFTGSPGAGKSTMLQLVADSFSRQGHYVVYVSGEESPYQIRMTSERLKLQHGFGFSDETQMPVLMPQLEALSAQAKAEGKELVVMFDSLQTLNDGKWGDDVNSKTAVRVLEQITSFCKATHAIGIVIGQVTKDGKMAGAQKLKHMVDVKVNLTIEQRDPDLAGCRVLECEKNRFGHNGTSFFLSMCETGFDVVAEISGR
jgi:DNA repair protein RadA/Sms